MSRFSKSFRPQIEALESRKLMAGDIGLANGVLSITGTDAYHDRATVSIDYDDQEVVVTMYNVNDAGQIVGSESEDYDLDEVDQIVFSGMAGNDVFQNLTYLPSTAYGGSGNDELRGGSFVNNLFGEDGNDALYGGNGIDTLSGGNGMDLLSGLGGTDYLYGGNDADTLMGGYGNDYLLGNDGADVLYGEAGNDYLDGGQDGYRDHLFGGAGADRFRTYPRFGIWGIYSPKLNEDWVHDLAAAEGDVVQY